MWGTEGWGLVALLGAMAFVANVLYMWGGTAGFEKFWRRFIASAILACAASIGAVVLGKWTWQYLCFYPCLAIGFSLPYGAEETIWKVIKRTIFALGVLTACVFGLWATGCTVFGLVVLSIAFVVGLTSVVLGVVNPFNSAPLEQFLICQVLCLFVPYWAFVR